MKKIAIQLEELVCPMCGQKIETALKKEPGVSEACVSYNSCKAKITFDETLTNPQRLETIIEDLGYIIIR